jgi:hypothetical protein
LWRSAGALPDVQRLPARQLQWLWLKAEHWALAESQQPVWQPLMLRLAMAAPLVGTERQSLELQPRLRAGSRPQGLELKDAKEERWREIAVSGWRSEHRRDEKFGKDRS